MAMKDQIKISGKTKDALDKLGHKGETYNEIIEKHLFKSSKQERRYETVKDVTKKIYEIFEKGNKLPDNKMHLMLRSFSGLLRNLKKEEGKNEGRI